MRRLPVLLTPLTLGLLALAAVAVPATGQESGEELTIDLCAGCHDQADTFAAGPHGRAMAAVDPAILERSCVTCHGPADEHVEDPSPENIHRFPGPEACASCHPAASGRLALGTPAHARNGVVCLDCHSEGHTDPGTEHMLAAAPRELCGSCHRTQANASFRPFAHRDGGEPFSCLSCHSTHSTERVGRLLAGANAGPCLDCHTEKAGPFVYPHPPRDTNGCITCHEPHGSTNPRLLKRHNVLNLCLECHTGVPAFHDLSQARFRACQSCHVAVHGSNRDPKFFDE